MSEMRPGFRPNTWPNPVFWIVRPPIRFFFLPLPLFLFQALSNLLQPSGKRKARAPLLLPEETQSGGFRSTLLRPLPATAAFPTASRYTGSSISREQKGITFVLETMYFEGYGYRGSTFEQTYRCYPASFIDKPQLEAGDKIIMPPSALDRLASLHIEYPMLFEVHNAAAERTSHCGVLEFIAEEGMIYMPYWMMQNLLLQEGDMVFIKNANLPKGTYVKLQPHTTDFLDISNPKAILEKTLRNFSCLTTGDSIMVAYNNKKYYIDIVETKPSNAISIIETDCEVDFAPPLDYKEPEPVKPAVPANTEPTGEAPAEEEPKFIPFTGSGRRLDGKPSKDKDMLASCPAKRQANATNSVQPSTASTSQGGSSRKTTGKLVFGSGGNRADKAPEKEAKEEPKKEEPKFSAFTGKKYSLKG